MILNSSLKLTSWLILASLFAATPSAHGVDAPYHVYTLGRSVGSTGLAILRYRPGQDPFPTFGSFDGVVVEANKFRQDIETDGKHLFVLERDMPGSTFSLSSYTLDGDFVREITELPSVGAGFAYEDGYFYVSGGSGELRKIDRDGNISTLVAGDVIGAGFDKFPGGFIATDFPGIDIYDDTGQLLSSVDLGLVADAVAIDDANRIAYVSNLSQEFASVDFSDPLNPVVLDQGMAAGGMFLTDFNPFTGHIFGTSLGVPFELDTDGSLVTQYFGGNSGFKIGVAVVPVPEPAPTMGTLLIVCFGWRRFGTRR